VKLGRAFFPNDHHTPDDVRYPYEEPSALFHFLYTEGESRHFFATLSPFGNKKNIRHV